AGETQIGRAQLDDAERNFQPATYLRGIVHHLVKFIVQRFRANQLDHLDLVELMAALDAADVAPRRHLLAPEARRVCGQVNRQNAFVESFIAMEAGQRNLGGRDEPEVVLFIVVHRVPVLREMPSARDSLAIHHQRRDYLEVSLLLLDIEHPRDQRALEPRARAAQDIETRAREFYSAIELAASQILA